MWSSMQEAEGVRVVWEWKQKMTSPRKPSAIQMYGSETEVPLANLSSKYSPTYLGSDVDNAGSMTAKPWGGGAVS